jgi:alpha-L-fucosidase
MKMILRLWLDSGYFISRGNKQYTNNLTDGKTSTYVTDSFYYQQSMLVELPKARKINCIVLREDLRDGQHCRAFTVLLMNAKTTFYKEIKGTTIGNKRILTFPAADINSIGLIIGHQKWFTRISEIEAYLIDDKLVEQ